MLVSHGRGGAGNYAKANKYDKVTPKDLQTPSLTSPVVTTGRGGSGNMLKNDDPKETRLRQDVQPVERRSSGAAYYGRGGAANIFRTTSRDEAEAAARKGSFESAIDDDASSAGGRRSSEFAARGKAWLQGLAGKKA